MSPSEMRCEGSHMTERIDFKQSGGLKNEKKNSRFS